MKIVAIVQARMTSTRLPGKVLLELPQGSGVTVLEQVIRRLKRVELIDEIVIAIPEDKEEDVLVPVIEKANAKVFRGDKYNVLERYYQAALENNADIIIRITSDCPCIDPAIVNDSIKSFLDEKADYFSSDISLSIPKGLDVEVISFNALEISRNNAESDYEKEHVTPYIYQSHPDKFKIIGINSSKETIESDIRITLDTPEDYKLLCTVFNLLYDINPYFNLKDIVNLYSEKPELKLINK